MKNKNLHPLFLKPTLIEAVVEIYLKNPFRNQDIDLMAQRLEKEYACKKGNRKVYMASFNDKGMKHEEADRLNLQLRRSEQCLTQVFSNRFSVHWLGKYQGWAPFESEFLKAWSDFQSIFPTIEGKRIGVRFINKLNEKTSEEPLEKWLKASPNYPKSLLSSKTNFFYRGNWSMIDEETVDQRDIMITIVEAEPTKTRNPFLLDIDVAQDCQKSLKNSLQIANLAYALHEDVWNIFFSSLSKTYKQLLKNKK